MFIEVVTFRLVPGDEQAAFLEADETLQRQLCCQKGFVRRTTARNSAGEWLVLTFWESEVAAKEAEAREDVEAQTSFSAFVDRATVTTKRFVTLD